MAAKKKKIFDFTKLKIIRTVNIKKIKEILPHEGNKILLDKVYLTTKLAIGKLKMRKDICEGHQISDWLIMPGAYYIEMAAQLLGVTIYFIPGFEHLRDKIFYFKDAYHISCNNASAVGDIIFISFKRDVNKMKVENFKNGRIHRFTAKKFTVTGEKGDVKGKISSIILEAMAKKLFIRLMRIVRNNTD